MGDVEHDLARLQQLLEVGLLTQEEFEAERRALVARALGHAPEGPPPVAGGVTVVARPGPSLGGDTTYGPTGSDPLLPSLPARIGKYLILGTLGSGGMGRVVRARHVEESWARMQGGDVAIKLIHPALQDDPGYRERFLAEANLGRQVTHPGVACVFDVISEGPWLGSVQSLVQGEGLDAWIVEGGQPLERVLGVLQPLAALLDHLHGMGIVHRDVKPANVKVREDGQPVLLDLGIAKALGGEAGSRTQAGMMLGSTLWMAPEQVDTRWVGPAADRYAFGLLAYALLTGRLPWEEGLSEGAVLVLKASGKLTPLRRHCSGEKALLDDGIMALLEVESEDRPCSLGAWLRWLSLPPPQREALDALQARLKDARGEELDALLAELLALEPDAAPWMMRWAHDSASLETALRELEEPGLVVLGTASFRLEHALTRSVSLIAAPQARARLETGVSVVRGTARLQGLRFTRGLKLLRGDTEVIDCEIRSEEGTALTVRACSPRVARVAVGGPTDGVWVYEGAGGDFSGLTIEGCGGHGITVESMATPTVRDSVIRGCGKTGLLLWQGAGGEYRNLDVEDNLGGAVMVAEGARPTLSGSRLRGGKAGLSLMRDGGGRFEGNDISGSSGIGIYVMDGQAGVFRGNEIHHTHEGVCVSGGGGGIFIDNDIHDTDTGFLFLKASKVEIRGGRLRGNGSFGAIVSVVEQALMEGCEVTGNGKTGVSVVSPAAHLELRRCRLHGEKGGVVVAKGADVEIVECEFRHCTVGVVVRESTPTVRSCTFEACATAAISFERQAGGVIEDNEIQSGGQVGVFVRQGSDPTLRRNRILAGGGMGVLVQENALGTLEENDILDHQEAGVRVRSGGRPTVRGNRVLGCVGGSIEVDRDGGGCFEGNTVSGQGVRVAPGAQAEVRDNVVHRG